METLESSKLETTGEPVASAQGLSLREVPWRWSDVLIAFAPLVLGRIASAILDPRWFSGGPRWLWIPLNVAGSAWMLGYPLAMAYRRQVERPRLALLPRPRALVVEALCALLAIPVILLGILVVAWLVTYLTGRPPERGFPLEPIARSPHQFERLALLFFAITVAPFAEETLFRGLLYNALRERLPRFLALPLQAIVFGFMHPFSIAQSSIVAMCGLGVGIVYEWRRKLLTPIILHFLWNLRAMTIMMAAIAASENAPKIGAGGEVAEGGCVVRVLAPTGPAANAGLRIGDVIASVDDEPVTDTRSISEIISRKHVGDQVTIEFLRNGESHRIDVVLKKQSDIINEKIDQQ